MRRILKRGCIVVGVVGLVASGVAARAAEAPAAPAMPEGQVWTEPPVLPWDQTAAQGASWATALNQEFSLARKGKAGEQRHYRFRRENLTLDRQGRILQRTLFEGALRRTLQEERQPGVWAERVEWEHFGTAQSQGPKDKPPVKELPGAKGFTFDLFPPTFDYLNPPGDYTKLGDPMLGYSLKVAMMDVAGFEALRMAVREDPKRTVQIGEATTMPRWQQSMQIKPSRGAEAGGDYLLGGMTVSVLGLTRRHGEPCLLLWFAAEGNDVKQDVENPQMTMHMHGTEYFRGTLAVSTVDGHIVAGELWGPLPTVMKMGFGGQPATEQPMSGFLQQVSMWETGPH